jgi:hypothetical protein
VAHLQLTNILKFKFEFHVVMARRRIFPEVFNCAHTRHASAAVVSVSWKKNDSPYPSVGIGLTAMSCQLVAQAHPVQHKGL